MEQDIPTTSTAVPWPGSAPGAMTSTPSTSASTIPASTSTSTTSAAPASAGVAASHTTAPPSATAPSLSIAQSTPSLFPPAAFSTPMTSGASPAPSIPVGLDTPPASNSASSSAGASRASPAPAPSSSRPAAAPASVGEATAVPSAPAGSSTPAGPLDPSTNYTFHRGVLSALTRMSVPHPSPTSSSSIPSTIDQSLLRRWLSLTPSFLLLDTSTAPAPSGFLSWQLGLQALINLMLALHSRGQLEWETMNAASRALAECWSISLCWSGMEGAKGAVQGAGGRLKAVLDKDDPTRYKGRVLYPVDA